MKLLTRLNEAINNTFKPLKSIEVVLLVSSFGVNASSAIALNELDFYGDNEMQSIAIGRPMANRLSPAVTSVMTATDIDRIGARTITEVLEYLPGVHVSQARSGGNIVSFRGISSEANSQVLILINGVPMRNVLFGGKPFGWNMPVKNISHIEVIRGPGSMLYGGDATTGVINIVLKTGAELKGGDAGAFIGNQGTESGWVQYGNKLNDLEFSGSLQGGTTTGYKGFIGQDAQSLIDTQFGTHASQAPGFTNNGRDDVDARIDLNYKDWIQLRGGYQRFNNVQTGFGSAYALDNKGYTNNDVYNVDLSLKNQLFDTLDNKTSVYYLGERPNSYFYNLPIGSFGGLLPKGAIDLGDGVQQTLGIKSQFNYSGIKDHNVTAETGFIDYWNSGSNKVNYIITPNFVQQIGLTNVSSFGTDPILASTGRTNSYSLIQDEWDFASNWHLTTGFRYDYYSDVSPGFSPRAALVWNTALDLTTKLMYSRSYRPPSFFEKNLPLFSGTTLKPETVDTLEFQIEQRWTKDLTTSANMYWYKADNLITSLPTTSITPVGFFNNNRINNIGVEAEIKYVVTDNFTGTLNYSYNGMSKTIGTGLMPASMFKGLMSYEITRDWTIGTQLNWIGERVRSRGDPRSPLAGSFTTGVTLSTKIAKPLDLTLRVNNVFNVNAMEPSYSWVLLPGDIPTLGRTILGQVKVSF